MTKVGKTQETKRPGCNITVFATGCQLETPRKVRTTTPRSHCTEAMGGEGLEMLKKHHVFQPRRYFVTIRGDDISRGSIVNCQQLTITDGEGLERWEAFRSHKFASRKSLSVLLSVTPYSDHILMFQKMDIKLCDVLPLRDGNILFHLRISLMQIPQMPRRRVYPQSWGRWRSLPNDLRVKSLYRFQRERKSRSNSDA